MNITHDPLENTFMKNLTQNSVGLGALIIYINGTFVFAFFKNANFCTDPRYILYIHLVINDIIMLFLSVSLQVISYTVIHVNVTVCCFLLLFTSTTTHNTTLNLAGMALERYIAICKPLHHSNLCTVKRTCILICLIWLLAVTPALTDIIIVIINQPDHFFSSLIMCYKEAVYDTQQQQIKTIFVQVLYLSFVWMTLIFTYYKVVQAAKAVTSDTASARKARNTILLHSVQLLLCMLTYFCPIINYYFVIVFPKYRATIMFSTYLLFYVSPRLLSALIYGVRDQKMFRFVRMYLIRCVLRTWTKTKRTELLD